MDLYLNKFKNQNSPPKADQPMAEKLKTGLKEAEVISLVYHDIFDYPLTLAELVRWKAGEEFASLSVGQRIKNKNGFYFLEGREGTIYKRILRQRISLRKLEKVRKIGQISKFIPTVRFVGVSGALAMGNAPDEGDIDLIIITKKGTLWLTRLLVLSALRLFRIPTRRFRDKNEKDKICLNMWLDEDDLIWRKGRNPYSSHEIAQVIPILNKVSTYEKFIWKNRWIKRFWPNSVKVTKVPSYKVMKKSYLALVTQSLSNLVTLVVEKLAFQAQYQYMKSRITRETVTPTRALFHPIDWGKIVISRLG